MQKVSHKSLAPFIVVAIVIISAAMHARHFNKELMGLHVWRQTETQSTINNFYDEDMNIFNPRRNDRGNGEGFHRMEFPLMQWLVAGTYKIFGNHLIISRIIMFIIGIFSVFGMYKLLLALSGHEFSAVVGAWAFNFSPSFYYYTINPMPDNLALCFGIWGLAIFFKWVTDKKLYLLILSGFLLALSALCKLPFILYFSVPLAYFFYLERSASGHKLQASSSTRLHSLIRVGIIMSFSILPLAWYIAVIPGWQGNGIVQGMLDVKVPVAVLLDNLQHHLFITSTELLLNYGSVFFFLAGIYFIIKKKSYKNPLFPAFAGLGILLVVYVLFELNMIGKSHDYYFFPFLPVMFILVAYGAKELFFRKVKLIKLLVIILLLILPLTAYLRIDQRWNPEKPGFNRDLLIYKDELRQAVPDDARCVAGNDQSHFIFFYYIDKKGWGFDYDNLDGKNLERMIEEGAEYLYSDSRAVEQKDDVKRFLYELILERGSVKVFKIR